MWIGDVNPFSAARNRKSQAWPRLFSFEKLWTRSRLFSFEKLWTRSRGIRIPFWSARSFLKLVDRSDVRLDSLDLGILDRFLNLIGKVVAVNDQVRAVVVPGNFGR